MPKTDIADIANIDAIRGLAMIFKAFFGLKNADKRIKYMMKIIGIIFTHLRRRFFMISEISRVRFISPASLSNTIINEVLSSSINLSCKSKDTGAKDFF